MRNVRKYLATALIVSLVGSTMGMTAWARSGGVVEGNKGWYQEGDGWHFYSSTGKHRVNEHRVVKDVWYAFDEDGRMYADELFVGPLSIADVDSEGNEICNRYAYPSGKLAQGPAWLMLNADGTMHEHDDKCKDNDCEGTVWYFLKKADMSDTEAYSYDGTAPYNVGEIVAGEERTVQKKIYAFKENGQMYSRAWLWGSMEDGKWVPTHHADAGSETETRHYYKYQGERVTDDWLYIDGEWHYFDANGDLRDSRSGTDDAEWATLSNAECLYAVKDIKAAADNPKEYAPGEKLELKFQVNLASSSDAKPVFKENKHDTWFPRSLRGTAKVTINEDGLAKVSYTASTTAKEDYVYVVIDGVKSEAVELKVKAVDNTDQTESKDAVEKLLDTAVNDDSVTKTDVRESLKEVWVGTDTKETPAEVKEALKATLVSDSKQKESYLALADGYAKENDIEEKVEADDVAETLPENSRIEAVGGSLNADSSSVVLTVTKGDPEKLEEQHEVKVAFDITYAVDGQDTDSIDFPIFITIPVPTGLSTDGMTLLHYHGDNEPEKVKYEVGEDENGNKTITFVTDKFSTYVFAGKAASGGSENPPVDPPVNPSKPSGGSSSGGSSGGSSRTTASGQWVLDTVGWWYKDANGGYPYSTWRLLEYNKKMEWYHFNEKGYINIGWFTDADGKIYYLNPLSNGFMGAMLTGWQQIDGYWYYFNEQSDGSKGALYVNTMTPDGHRVNEKGQRVD